MSEQPGKYKRYRPINKITKAKIDQLEKLADSTTYKVEPPSLENTTYVAAKTELAFLSKQIEIIEQLNKRKGVLIKRVKELQKFITNLEKLESVEEKTVEKLISETKVYNEDKHPNPDISNQPIQEGHIDDFL